MDEKEANRERRKQRALERLGTATPRCIYCGEDDWRVLEAHHVAGQKFDSETVIVCRNHHRILSDDQKDHPPSVGNPPRLHECIGHFLKGLADLFALLVAKLYEFGDALIEFAKSEAAAGARGDK